MAKLLATLQRCTLRVTDLGSVAKHVLNLASLSRWGRRWQDHVADGKSFFFFFACFQDLGAPDASHFVAMSWLFKIMQFRRVHILCTSAEGLLPCLLLVAYLLLYLPATFGQHF